eukprot:TRINITY_DN106447_c0_g1_i1.p1 TRINITY_DN106447_c0_g1~~TRINITY_DN106447_c0_g1_i1.p1  ORF type:complete len:289 (-),score=45.10 TRINITY_DN106447_c0_g1_i1:194-1060(-)
MNAATSSSSSASASSALVAVDPSLAVTAPPSRSRASSGGTVATQHAGAFIEHPQLTQLSAMLKAIDAGDRIIKGRLELFNCSRKRLSLKQQQDILRHAPESLSDSPLGPMSSDSSQVLLANLVALMGLLFVDYDCSSISPHDFELCSDKHTVVNNINHNLASVVDRVHTGFLSEFWQGVQDAIDVVNCQIYAFQPKSGGFEPMDNSLSSFHYFFVDVILGRILFIGSFTRSRDSLRSGMDSESDVTLSQQDASSVASKEHGSSMGSSLAEGDYAFGSDASDDDAAMAD